MRGLGHRRQALAHGLLGDIQLQRHGDRARQVGGVGAGRGGPHRATPHVDGPAGHGDLESGGIGGTDPDHPSPACLRRRHPGQMRIVDVEDGHRGPGQNLRLRRHDPLDGAEPLEMDRPDRGDDGDVGRDPGAELGDLARAVGAHLRHEHVDAAGEVLVDRPGQAETVVERGRAGQHPSPSPHQVGDVALGAGLPVGAGDRHHGGARARQLGGRLGDPAVARPPLHRPQQRQGQVGETRQQHHPEGGHGHRSRHPHRGEDDQAHRRPRRQAPQTRCPGQLRRAPAEAQPGGSGSHGDRRGQCRGRIPGARHRSPHRHPGQGQRPGVDTPPPPGETAHRARQVMLTLGHPQPAQHRHRPPGRQRQPYRRDQRPTRSSIASTPARSASGALRGT